MTLYAATDLRVKVYDRDGSTLRGTFKGLDCSVSSSKDLGSEALDFVSLPIVDDDWSANVFDDGLARVEVFHAGSWTAVGPLYRTRGDATVVNIGEAAVIGSRVTGESALSVFSNEWQVTPGDGVWFRRSSQVIFLGWQSGPEFDDSDFVTPIHLARSDAVAPKLNNPPNWQDQDADWVYFDPDLTGPGGLALNRLPAFVVPDTAGDGVTGTQVRIASTADEEHKVYLWGPGYGGVVIDSSKEETGYTEESRWDRVLAPGTYYVAAERTGVKSTGGDGFDALSISVHTLDADDKMLDVLVNTGDAVLSLRQGKDASRPGLTAGHIFRLLLDWYSAWTTNADASNNVITRDFTATADSDGTDWPDLHERSWPVQTPYSQIIADLHHAADVYLTPGGVLQAFIERGSDLSATVQLVKGENVTDVDCPSEPPTATRGSALTPDGFTVYVDDDLEGDVSARSIGLESVQSSSVAEGNRLLARTITRDGFTDVTFVVRALPSTGCIPGIHADWGDTIMTPDRSGAPSPQRIMSWAIHRVDEHLECDWELT